MRKYETEFKFKVVKSFLYGDGGAKLRLLVRRVLRRYKYPPDLAEEAIALVLQSAERFGEDWSEQIEA